MLCLPSMAKRPFSLASREDPDLMLLDIQLPEINGIETLRRTRKDNPTPTPS